MDINAIRAWLGHVPMDTTNVYAEVALEPKAQKLTIRGSGRLVADVLRDNAPLAELQRVSFLSPA